MYHSVFVTFNSIAVTVAIEPLLASFLFLFLFLSFLFFILYEIQYTNVYEEKCRHMWSDGNLIYTYSWFNSFAHVHSGWSIERGSWACDELNNQIKTKTSNSQEEWTEKRYRKAKMMTENNVVGFHFKCKWLPEILAKARIHEPLNGKSLPNIISDENWTEIDSKKKHRNASQFLWVSTKISNRTKIND